MELRGDLGAFNSSSVCSNPKSSRRIFSPSHNYKIQVVGVGVPIS